MATLAPQATCPLPHSQRSPDTSGGNKEKAFIAQGGGQETKLIFLAYALCSGRQHTEMISLMCSLKYLYLCVYLLQSQISV